ncbi:MAG: phosphoribosylaminoimidazolesuccinocarboxamide synthase [Nitrospirota bacterium]|nr:phosphoribosylaminoimidazolesuccinocarboxamide synthase [Nitrospirota bacterium]
MEKMILEADLPELEFSRRGKVRDIYDMGDSLLLIASDRISAFDVVLPSGIPGKGRLLTMISIYWFRQMEEIIRNHLIATDVNEYPEKCHKYREQLEGRSMLVKKAQPLPVECIVRGYLSGSGWKEYSKSGTVCGIKLPAGLKESSRLDYPIFTPSTKAEKGHDINISFEEAAGIVGRDMAEKLKDVSLKIYSKAVGMAAKKGVIIADTKFEFGICDNELILIDEILTPDSSRFWSIDTYEPGKAQDSYDKQIIRDYLLTLDWNQTYPGPKLPEDIVRKTQERYEEIYRIVTG